MRYFSSKDAEFLLSDARSAICGEERKNASQLLWLLVYGSIVMFGSNVHRRPTINVLLQFNEGVSSILSSFLSSGSSVVRTHNLSPLSSYLNDPARPPLR